MSIIEEPSVKLISKGQVAQAVINRPQDLNALNPDVLHSIELLLAQLEKEKEARVLILTGAGEKAFVAGADIKHMEGLGPRAIADYIELGQRAMRAIELSPLVVIAAVNGYALGGGFELALACDLIIASDTAKFGQPEVNLGIIPGFGGTQRLIARAGVGVARRLTYTGDLITAEEALKIGVIEKVVPAAELVETSKAIGHALAAKAPLALQKVKEVIRTSQESTLLPGLRHEVAGFLELFATADREEGMQAFLEKRAPKYVGK